MGIFAMVSDRTIKRGRSTDICFLRTEQTQKKEGIHPQDAMEVTATGLPDSWADRYTTPGYRRGAGTGDRATRECFPRKMIPAGLQSVAIATSTG